MFKNISISIEIVTFLEFTWLAFFFFHNSKSKNIGVKVIKLFGTLAVVIDLFFVLNVETISLLPFTCGLFFFLISNLLLWSAFYTNKTKPLDFAFSSEPKNFVQRGPYRLIRHPFYASYLAAWIGALIWTPSIFTALVFVVMLSIYYKATVKEETDFLKSSFGDQYALYIKETYKFFPRFSGILK